MLAVQQVQERKEQTADLIASGLEQSLTAAEQVLQDPSAIQALAQPQGGVSVIFTTGRVDAFPKGRLLYDPVASRDSAPPPLLG